MRAVRSDAGQSYHEATGFLILRSWAIVVALGGTFSVLRAEIIDCGKSASFYLPWRMAIQPGVWLMSFRMNAAREDHLPAIAANVDVFCELAGRIANRFVIAEVMMSSLPELNR